MRAWTVGLAVMALACGAGNEAASQDVESAQSQAESAVAANREKAIEMARRVAGIL